MSQRYPRNGTYAVLDGVTYRSTPVLPNGMVELTWKSAEAPPDGRFAYSEQWRLWEVTLPTQDCDELYSVSSRARYQGHVCQVMAIDPDGSTLLYYLEGDRGEAERLGFEQTDPGTHSTVVPVAELYDYHEERLDLLFDSWRSATFPTPNGTTPR